MQLARGQYRVSMLVPYDDDVVVHDRELPIAIPFEGEAKRVYFYKLSLIPVDALGPDGEPLGRLTVVFHVLDNPLPLIAIAWGAVVATGSVGAWFVIDKLESFTTQSFVGAALSLAAAAAGLLFLWNEFSD